MPAVAPLLLQPRLDPKPWGGRALARFGLPLPGDGPIGEAVITADEATVRGGRHDGRRLGDLVAENPAAALGDHGLAATGGRPVFPLLVKLLDAAENLSVQVHPHDAAAARQGDSLGKTEAWHVLSARPGSLLHVGLRPGVSAEQFAEACLAARGEAADLLRRLPAVPGTTVLIPAGTAHTLGAGVVLYEIQQPSTITYRLDDWGRLGIDGKPRELHLDQGLDVLVPALRPEPIAPVTLAPGPGRRQLLAACRYFALERIALVAGEAIDLTAAGTPQALTCLQGGAAVRTDGGEVALTAGETAVVLAGSPDTRLRATAPAVVLRGWVPDLAADVVAPARAALAAAADIVGLGGPLPDVGVAMAGGLTPSPTA